MRLPYIYDKQIKDRLQPEGECLIFTGALRNGYGIIKVGGRQGKTLYTHRITYETFCGDLSEGLFVMHSCNNPACCNPKHLMLGTQGMNMRYAAALGRLATPTPPPSKLGIRGVCAVWQSRKMFYRAYTTKPERQNLYWGQDFFAACCARKAWEAKNPTAKGA